MERASSLIDLYESIHTIPQDIQQSLLSIAQYGCRPDQVQRWYVLVREHFGANAPPPVGNLYEHEIVVTPLPPTPIAPSSQKPLSAPGPGLSNTRNTHGLGLSVDPVKAAKIPAFQFTPVSDCGPATSLPASTPRADSAGLQGTTMTFPGLYTPQLTPASGRQSICTPASDVFSFTVPALTAHSAPPTASLSATSTMQAMASPLGSCISHGGSCQSTSVDANPFLEQEASTSTSTPLEWCTSTAVQPSSSEPPPKRRRLTSTENREPRLRARQTPTLIRKSGGPLSRSRNISPRTPQLYAHQQQRTPNFMAPMSSTFPTANFATISCSPRYAQFSTPLPSPHEQLLSHTPLIQQVHHPATPIIEQAFDQFQFNPPGL